MTKLCWILFFMSVLLFGEQSLTAIQIMNHTEEPLFVALYYVKKQEAQRIGDLYELSPASTLTLIRPPRKWFYDRELIIAQNKESLSLALKKNEKEQLVSYNIGLLKGIDFHIAKSSDDKLHIYNEDRWLLRFGLVNVHADHFTHRKAIIRVGNELSLQEREFLEKRLPKVKMALESLLGRSLEDTYIPKIVLIGSGGGYRAMLGTTGFLSGADQIGLLDAITYITALSGSSWAVGCWISTGLSIGAFKDYLINTIVKNRGLTRFGPAHAKQMADIVLMKYAFDLPISLVDFYGGLLANALFDFFGNERQYINLSLQEERVKEGNFPLPIYTAISADKTRSSSDWYEFTPFEVGGAWLGLYVPAWAYGRLFKNGHSASFSPQQSFGFHMGTFGSAFAATFNDIYQEIVHMIPLKIGQIIQRLLKLIGKERISRAKVYNFTFGMDVSPIKDLAVLGLIDAGIDFNFPYPPVSGERSERSPDILIFLDSSAVVERARELSKAERYARDKNLKFPVIDYTDIDKRAVSVFMDSSDPSVPVVIYMPRIKDKELWQTYKEQAKPDDIYVQALDDFSPKVCVKTGFCRTFNFSYSEDQARKVILLTEFNMKMSREKIIDAINWVIENKTKNE